VKASLLMKAKMTGHLKYLQVKIVLENRALARQ
jgi:hypothetical protein